EATGITLEELLEAIGITLEGLLKSTGMASWEIQPRIAFVGDYIRFEGVLASKGKPLAGRKIDILLDSSRYITVKTDPLGYYQGMLRVPYWYVQEIDLQALYYPQEEDIGAYLASISPVINLKVLFYEAELEISVEDKVYLGLETTVTGRFDYGESPIPDERKVEIYLDDVFTTEIIAKETFAQEMRIDPEVDVGKHVITISASSIERYSSVESSAILNVTRATPSLDLDIPRVGMIPGTITLEGRFYSEVGPVSKALIEMELGKSQIEFYSSEDGSFDTRIHTGMGLGMIGSQDLVIRVLPQEPWHTPIVTSRSILIVNTINCGGILAILIFFGIYLPHRLRGRLGTYATRPAKPVIMTAPSEPAPTYSKSVTDLTITEEGEKISGEPRNRILYWYRLVARLIQGITETLLRPQQTLREFAYASSRMLGPAGKYFVELTKIVERLLYSQYSPTEDDAGKSEQLSHTIEGKSKSLVKAQSSPEGEGIRLEASNVSYGHGIEKLDYGARLSITGPWRQPSTWLWILVIAAVTFYACISLFVLPLMLIH
ncbi:DUF4129 domain-containing protein, partial [Chloroflexota bacterium]